MNYENKRHIFRRSSAVVEASCIFLSLFMYCRYYNLLHTVLQLLHTYNCYYVICSLTSTELIVRYKLQFEIMLCFQQLKMPFQDMFTANWHCTVSFLLKMEKTVESYCLSKFQVEFSTLRFEDKVEINRQWLEEQKIAAQQGNSIFLAFYW